jgi:hypothetical protein
LAALFYGRISQLFLTTMSLVISSPSPFLTKEEWRELQALRKAITDNPASVAPWKQEQSTALFARSLLGKGNSPL